MGYVAVCGGENAIRNSETLLQYYRRRGETDPIQVRQIIQQMRLAVDRVMAEGSLYDPTLAALAIKQTEGDLVEAAFLIRAYRSTLPRLQTTPLLRTSGMRLIRRIFPGDKFSAPPETTHSGSSTFRSWMSAALRPSRRAPSCPAVHPRRPSGFRNT
jgi:alpha-D-ribose 1-methylphosphonate 5-triphosphate synthase subunit PhnI